MNQAPDTPPPVVGKAIEKAQAYIEKHPTTLNELERRIAFDIDTLKMKAYFAAMAMQGILARDDEGYPDYESYANEAVTLADALIQALNKKKA